MGLHRAGFDVVGVDIRPQPRYPFEFHQGDAMTWPLDGFDFIWASPPCQGYSKCRHFRPNNTPRLVSAVRGRLPSAGCPWVIENVQGADLAAGSVMLCGTMFGLKVFRHRWFEASWLLLAPGHASHAGSIGRTRTGSEYGPGRGGSVCVAGHTFSRAQGSAAMGIDWMTRDELAQAIPPAYAQWIGHQAIDLISRRTTANLNAHATPHT